MSLDLKPKWAELLEELAVHTDAKVVREQLAGAYERAGYSAAARFFRRRPDEVESRTSQSDPEQQTPRWGCADRADQLGSIYGKADRIAEIRLAGDYAKALDEARSALAGSGPSCLLLVQWADAVLYNAMIGSTVVKAAEREAAVRLLITGIEELNVKPAQMAGAVGVYELLSSYFCARTDWISCYVALDAAIERLATDTVPIPATAKARLRKNLEERRRSVNERLQQRMRTPNDR